MRKNVKQMLVAGVTGLMVGSAITVSGTTMINAYRNDKIKVTLNGVEQTFRDATTGEVELPLTYNDRTYLPLRSLANLLGFNVDYDDATETAMLTKEAGSFINTMQKYGSLDLTNTLVWENDTGLKCEVSADGATITTSSSDDSLKTIYTNLSIKAKSIRIGSYMQSVAFYILDENGDVYQGTNWGQDGFKKVASHCVYLAATKGIEDDEVICYIHPDEEIQDISEDYYFVFPGEIRL